ncbi:MAG: hypothetical protein WD875_11980 [Pirellulales bacterium]
MSRQSWVIAGGERLDVVVRACPRQPDGIGVAAGFCLASAVNFLASSAEFVGESRLREGSEVVVDGDFQYFGAAEAVGFSRRQIGFVVEIFDDAG